ncbi:MAG: extracellular solute-binding protein [Acetanaerobacterium sp.]
MKQVAKKTVACLLIAGMVAGMTACATPAPTPAKDSSTPSSPDEKITLSYWHIMTDGPGKPMIKGIIDTWNTENPNVQIEASVTLNDPYKTKIKTAIAANEAPDIIYSWTQGFAQPFVKAGKILCLDDYLDDETMSKMLPGALDNITYDGKVYGLTYAQQASALYMNADLFAQYDVKAPTTFDELLTAIKTFKDNGIVPMALGNKDEWPGMWLYDMLALRTGGSDLTISSLENKTSFTEKPFADAASSILALVDAGAFDAGVMGLTADEANASFIQGKAAMVYGGNFWAMNFAADETFCDKVQIMPFPSIEGGQGDPTEYIGGGSDALLVNANSEHKDEAVAAIKYLAPEISTQSYQLGVSLPEWKYDGVDVSNLDSLTLQIMDNIVKDSSGSVPAWDIFLTGAKAQTHKDLVAQLFGKTITAEEFAQQMQSQVNG